MTIRRKTLLLTIILLTGSLLLVSILARLVIVRETKPLEFQNVQERIKLVTFLINKNVTDLEKWIIDWAQWDDTYNFMATGSQKFITVDLSPTYFKVYDIEHVLFLAPDGTVRFACSYDFKQMTTTVINPQLLEQLTQIARLNTAQDRHLSTSGFFRQGNSFFAVAAHPVLNSTGKGPSRGILVFADELEPDEQEAIGTMIAQPFSLRSLDDTRFSQNDRQMLRALTPSAPFLIRFLDEQSAEGFTLLPDLLNSDGIAVRVTTPRPLFDEAQRISSYFIFVVFGVGALLIAAMTTLLRRTVLTPLTKMSRQVAQLDFSSHPRLIDEPDGDEFSKLASALNEAIERLQHLKDEADTANQAKSEFLAAMSHELRTPLSTILGFTEGLQQELFGELTLEQKNATTVIDESAQHLLALINDVLDLARIEAGKMILTTQWFALEEFCRSCLRLVTKAAEKKQITLSLNLRNVPKGFETDSLRLKQILLNLLNNAIKFTPPGGTAALDVQGEREAARIRFMVSDTGIGIDDKDRERLFKPFVQLDSGMARQFEGSGLGLVLVSRLTEHLGGTFSMESRLGSGSRFTVLLPWRGTGDEPDWTDTGSCADTVPEPVVASSCGRSARILLVDDNPDAIALLSKFLHLKGYRIDGTLNGNEALDLITRNCPDLVILDVQMPGMTGLEVMQHIRALPAPAAHLPVIVLTARAMAGDREQCLKAGASIYLSKPVRLSRLAEAVESLLTGHGNESDESVPHREE